MILRDEILKEHSKAQCDKIVAWVGASQKRFDELVHLLLTDNNIVKQRASWPMSYAAIAHPKLVMPHFDVLIKNIQKPQLPPGVKRNTIKLMEQVPIPETQEGNIMNVCFDFLASPTEEVAVKASCITVLGILAKRYPEIIPEIKMVIEEQLPRQTAAFKSRARQLYNKWK